MYENSLMAWLYLLCYYYYTFCLIIEAEAKASLSPYYLVSHEFPMVPIFLCLTSFFLNLNGSYVREVSRGRLFKPEDIVAAAAAARAT